MSCRTKLISVILVIAIWSSFIFGLLPFRYERTKRKLLHSKQAVIYTLSINLIALGLLVLCGYLGSRTHEYDEFVERSLDAIIIYVDLALSAFALLLAIYSNWTGYDVMFRLFTEMLSMEYNYFRKRNYHNIKHTSTESFIVWKGTLSMLQVLSNVYTIYAWGAEPSFNFIVAMLLVTLFQIVLQQISIQFCYAALFVQRAFSMLHQRVQYFLAEIKKHANCKHLCLSCIQRNCDMSEEIDGMAVAYLRLFKITNQIQKLYEFQLLLQLILFLIGNVSNLFYFCVTLSEVSTKKDLLTKVVFPQIVLMNIADFFLIFKAAEMVTISARDLKHLLHGFCEFTHLDGNLTASLDTFALLQSCDKMQFRLCGMFWFGHLTAFEVSVASFFYFIVLVQFDYDSILGNQQIGF